jgi:outer membrane protein insertion porin family
MKVRELLCRLVPGLIALLIAPVLMAAAGPKISEVRVRGNDRVDEQAIVIHMKSEAGDVYTPKSGDDDIRAVWDLGFFDDVQIHIDPDPKRRGQVIYTVEVLERPLIDGVSIEGEHDVDTTKLDQALGVRARTIYDA